MTCVKPMASAEVLRGSALGWGFREPPAAEAVRPRTLKPGPMPGVFQRVSVARSAPSEARHVNWNGKQLTVPDRALLVVVYGLLRIYSS